MTKIYSKKFTETFYKADDNLILTSPYKNSNLLLFLIFKDDEISTQVFKYIFDPIEPEIKFCEVITNNQELQSALQLKVPMEFLLPGHVKNELILVSKNGDVWNAFEQGNSVKLSKRIGKIDFNQIEANSLSFFDIFDPIDIIAYFTKRTKDFACLIIKEIDRFYILLNTKLFSKVSSDNSIIEFEDSIAFWNSSAENLDLFSFNKMLGLAHINFPRNKINKEVPISITNLKKFDGIPKDICCINDALYVVTTNEFHIYPSFKKYKTLKSISLPFSSELIWFEPQYRRCKVVYNKGKFLDFVISPTLSEITIKSISVETDRNIICNKDSKIKCIGNNHFGVIYNGSECYIWTKKEHITTLKTHNLIILELRNPIPNALESLQRLKDLNLMDFSQMVSITEARLPKSLLKLKKRRIRFFTKKEDLFIIDHVYSDLTYLDMAKNLNRTPISIYTHLKMIYGTPTCEKHNKFQKSCKKCADDRIIWVKECKEIVEKKKYYKPTYEEGEVPEFDLDEFIRKDKKRRLRYRTSFFKNILSPELYNNILDFIIDTDLLKGRSINKIFEQSIQIFVDDHLRNSIISGKMVPNHLLELYFGIKKDLKTLKNIYKPYKEKVNSKYSPIGDFNFFFKDLMNLRKLYKEEICREIRPYLLDFNKDLSKIGIKDGYIAGLLYIIYKEINKGITQSKLGEIFRITEVTLRNRINDVGKLLNRKKSLEYIKKISEIIRNNKTIQELKEEEKAIIINFNKNIKNYIFNQSFEKIPNLIDSLRVNYKEKHFPLISDSLELIARIENNSIISTLIDFLVENNYYNDEIFDNLIKFLGSEDDAIVNNIKEFIYFLKPELENADIYEIIDNLSKNQNISILTYIKANQLRSEKKKGLKDYIQDNFFVD